LAAALALVRVAARAKVLACAGAADPFCPPAQRAAFEREITEARADWQLHVYRGALHGFSVPTIDPVEQPGCAYEPKADARSWSAMLELFGEV
jgi:dienelactone hydrolase